MSLLFAIFAASAQLAAARPTLINEPRATIASGIVVGTSVPVSSDTVVEGYANLYLGVPFARSPIGTLRFSPPVASEPWAEPYVAQTLPPACLQQFASGDIGATERRFFNNPGLTPPVESEDCLFLNVYTPQNASSTALKPVLFWLFGGNLQFGTASLAYYDGSFLAVHEDVIVVVPNYRTNIFGFSNSPQIPFGQQNSGFLDQRFALQWVQDNIQAFGGDPEKARNGQQHRTVTLFGESAGAYSIKQLLANPPSPAPFRAAILESSQTGLVGSGLLSYEQTLANFGCAFAFSPIDCLRAIPAEDIETYVSDAGLMFPPVMNDGTYIGSDTIGSILSGQFADVPILIGTNKDEARIFLAVAGLENTTNIPDAVQQVTQIDITGIAELVINEYPDIADDTFVLLSRIITDVAFTCTTSTFASAIAAQYRQAVWRYRYDASFPNVNLFPNAGAYHTVEIPEVWGTYPSSNILGSATPTQIKLSRAMQSIWAGFARNPNAGPGWPRLNSAAGVELGVLGGSHNTAGESTRPLAEADNVCRLYNPLLLAAGQSF